MDNNSNLLFDKSSSGKIGFSLPDSDCPDISFKEKAKKLFVRYVATGMLWKRNDMFQLSVELIDTKDNKIIWSDRWEENWDNLTSIKKKISDGLLKSLNLKPYDINITSVHNIDAYEYYLRAKHKFEKRKTVEDVDLAKDLLEKAIQLDGKLVLAKIKLASIYEYKCNYNKAILIYKDQLTIAKNKKDEFTIGQCLKGIGHVHWGKGEYENAIKLYYKPALEIFQKLKFFCY